MTRTERQYKCIENWVKSGGRSTVVACTGFGKTFLGLTVSKLFLQKNPNEKVLVVVPTDLLKTQWTLQLNQMGLLSSVDVEVINTAIKREHEHKLYILDKEGICRV